MLGVSTIRMPAWSYAWHVYCSITYISLTLCSFCYQQFGACQNQFPELIVILNFHWKRILTSSHGKISIHRSMSIISQLARACHFLSFISTDQSVKPDWLHSWWLSISHTLLRIPKWSLANSIITLKECDFLGLQPKRYPVLNNWLEPGIHC